MSDLTIADLSIGTDKAGTETYLEDIKAQVLTNVKEKINDFGAVETAIKGAWQGVSRDRFLEVFEGRREKTCAALEAEYEDIKLKIRSISAGIAKIDEEIASGIQ